MRATQMIPNTQTSPPGGGGDKPLVHAVCRSCYPTPGPDDRGMCGSKPATPAVHTAPPADRPMCVICAELHLKPCERCGQ